MGFYKIFQLYLPIFFLWKRRTLREMVALWEVNGQWRFVAQWAISIRLIRSLGQMIVKWQCWRKRRGREARGKGEEGAKRQHGYISTSPLLSCCEIFIWGVNILLPPSAFAYSTEFYINDPHFGKHFSSALHCHGSNRSLLISTNKRKYYSF